MSSRRDFVRSVGCVGALALGGCATSAPPPSSARVVVVGGGYGGATAARYVRLGSAGAIDVVLVEPRREFVSCPLSNLVVGGVGGLADLTLSYDGLRRHGVTIVHDRVTAIDAERKTVRLARGPAIRYDQLIVSPGVDLMFDGIDGLRQAREDGIVLQAWEAGSETVALHRQLAAMRDGGTYAITIPEAPYRCPPGPYERASLVAAYFKAEKPASKVLILDANPDVTSKPALFRRAWSELYPGMVEYRPHHRAVAVDRRTRTVRFEVQDNVTADVLNVLPPMRAGRVAVDAGLATVNARWCSVDYRTFESTVSKDVHVIGDSIQVAPAMPKSAHMANNHAKVAAAAVVARFEGRESNPRPMLTNTCYSWVSRTEAIHVASVHAFVAAERTFRTVAGSGGVSAARSALEASYADGWARNIWADTLG